MKTCLNLLTLFGDRYRISWDHAYDPRRRRTPDVWMMLLTFRNGEIFPWGGRLLAVTVAGRASLRRALAALPQLQLVQDCDREQTWTFPMEEFETVAAIVKPHRRTRCTLTTEQRAANAERLKRLTSSKRAFSRAPSPA